MNKPNRYPIAIDNGIFLCNDGTMWARKNGLVEVGTSEWIQIDSVPQPDQKDLDEINDFHARLLRERFKERREDKIKQSDRIALYAYTDNCCTE